ncbi:MAG: hypothetical protein IT453_18860 [Planctomycetes bacterium]|nr:hypothetical protein [Planctomycetota bacterium]
MRQLLHELRASLFLAAILGFATAAFGQTPLHSAYGTLDVDQWTEFDSVANDARFRKQVRAAFAADIDAARWSAVFSKLAAEFGNSARSSDPVGSAAQATFGARLDELAKASERAQAAAAPDGSIDTHEELARFFLSVNRAGFGAQTFVVAGKRAPLARPNAQPRAGFFLDAARAKELPGEILLTKYDAADEQTPNVPLEVAVDLRLRADALATLFALATAELRDEQIGMVTDAKAHWDAYLDRGYSQYPWEEWLNGFEVDADSLEPPRWQWIALHPSAAIELDVSGVDDLRISEALNLELVGRIRYDSDFEDFHGASLSLLVRDDIGPGLGAVVHLNRSFNLGVAWHDADEDDDWFDEPPFVFCSLDLFRLVESRSKNLRRRLRDPLDSLPSL